MTLVGAISVITKANHHASKKAFKIFSEAGKLAQKFHDLRHFPLKSFTEPVLDIMIIIGEKDQYRIKGTINTSSSFSEVVTDIHPPLYDIQYHCT